MTGCARFSFEPLVCADIPLLRDWYQRPHIKEWWPDCPSQDEMQVWCDPLAREPRQDLSYIARLERVDPAGFIQVYVPSECHDDGWWLEEHDPGVRGLDIFLANPEQRGRGLGTVMVREFTDRLLGDSAVTRVQGDPACDNLRAIRCYEKAGFRAVGDIVTPDGRALLMYLNRPSLRAVVQGSALCAFTKRGG